MDGLKADTKGVLVACASCGLTNRVPFSRSEYQVRCGKCHTALPHIDRPIVIQAVGQFEQLTTQASLPVLVDFWASWCGPCKAAAPELEKLAKSNAGRLLIAKVETDSSPELARRYSIASLPTFALFLAGSEIARTEGARPAIHLQHFLNESLLQAAG